MKRNFLFLTVIVAAMQGIQANTFDLEQFLLPVPITRESLEKFFTLEFNNPRYVREKLPYSLENLSKFLRHGKQTSQGRKYCDATMRLFKQKVSESDGLSGLAFTEWLNEFPGLVDHLFAEVDKGTGKKKAVKNVLYREFLSQFKELSANPASFFDHLADEVLAAADPDANQEISRDHLRQVIIRFLETCISRLFWDPADKDTWTNMRQIGELLGKLYQHKIIADRDDLNDLCWSLVHRICHHINTFSQELPLEFYEELRKEIQNPSSMLLTLEEQEALITSKRQALERVVLEGVAKIHADQMGLVTQ